MATTATFFIPDRLRGIPLVTGGRLNQDQSSKVTTTTTIAPESNSQSITSTEKSSTLNMEPISTSRLKLSADTMKLVQVEKREADSNRFGPDNQRLSTRDSGILFKPSAMTASTSNIVRSKPQSTTRRPPTTTPNSTRKWRTTAKATSNNVNYHKRTTPKPKINPEPNKVQKLAQLIRPTEPRTRTTTKIVSTTSKPTTTTFSKPINELPTEATSNSMADTSRTSQPQSTDSVPNLTKSLQSLTTQPLNQRRTPQTVTFPRYTNRLSESGRSAGENWVLFNRPDGSFSFFEVLVLCSNIMIVGTIVLIIIMSWMRSMKKKRANQQRNQPIGSPTITNQANTMSIDQAGPSSSQPLDIVSDRGSKLSMISSGISNLDSATISDSSHPVTSNTLIGGVRQMAQTGDQTINQLGKSIERTSNMVKSKAEEATGAVVNASQQVVGSAQNISSEFKTSGMNVANKAMAIVQPTENNNNTTANSSANSESDKMANPNKDELLGQTQRTISRSVSDLSGSAKLKKDDPNVKEAKESSKVLEDLFNGSEPNLASVAADEVKKPKEEIKLQNVKNEPKVNKHLSDSLESIELPGELVESIKKSGPRNPDHIVAPSPNMLLGEVEPPTKVPTVSEPPTKSIEINKNKPEVVGQSSKTGEKKNNDTNGKAAVDLTGKKDDSSKKPDPTVSSTKSQPSKAPSDATKDMANIDRPQNPMGSQLETKVNDTKKVGDKKQSSAKKVDSDTISESKVDQPAAQVKNHQVVVNKLDKRKTNLEIVDLRDESVTGKMRASDSKDKSSDGSTGKPDDSGGWISMDGLAVVQPAAASTSSNSNQPQAQIQQQQMIPQTPNAAQIMSPSEIIESRFHVDYSNKRRNNQSAVNPAKEGDSKTMQQDSMDSKTEEYLMNNIENELELDNKMKNRKYFVYIVHDGHFTAKKECIARIELPPKRRITLAELRQLIASSQDISLSSLRRNRFKFVTETYRLLNENEDAAVLHQVYPTQGVFLKLNIPEQENQSYPYKGRNTRLSSGSGNSPSSLSHTTIASRRRATNRTGQPRSGSNADSTLPAIEVEEEMGNELTAPRGYGRTRAVSVGRRPAAGGAGRANGSGAPGGAYRRSKSSVQQGVAGRRTGTNQRTGDNYSNRGSRDRLPSIGRSNEFNQRDRPIKKVVIKDDLAGVSNVKQTLGETATDLGANVISGAKKLLNTFHF